ncbi:hypothetical protein IAR50_006119 [Cryptococcus sp. DSM 104548]
MAWPTPTLSSLYSVASQLASSITTTSLQQSQDKPIINLSTPESEIKTNRLYMLEEMTDKEPWSEKSQGSSNKQGKSRREAMVWREYRLNTSHVTYNPPLTNDRISINAIPARLREAACSCDCGKSMVESDIEAGKYLMGKKEYERSGDLFRRVDSRRRRRGEDRWEHKVVGGVSWSEETGIIRGSRRSAETLSFDSGLNVSSLEFGKVNESRGNDQSTGQQSSQKQKSRVSFALYDDAKTEAPTKSPSPTPPIDLAWSDHAEDFLRGLPDGTTASKRAAISEILRPPSSPSFSETIRPPVTSGSRDTTSKRTQFAPTSPPHTDSAPDLAWGDISAEARRFLTTGQFREEL